MNDLYTIGQLAKLAGISTKTLRVYERKGLLLPERNEENKYRVYGEEAVQTLEKIQLMKYLDFSLDQIAEFLALYENVSREEMLLKQKRLLEKKREQLNRVIAHVDRAVKECQDETADSNAFLKSLGMIVKNQRADEVAGRLGLHSDEPRGWSRFLFDVIGLKAGMQVLDAGAGYGNFWRYNMERFPEQISVAYVDKHNTHADTFFEYIKEQKLEGNFETCDFSFVWDDLETMPINGTYDRIFFHHVFSYIEDREALYRKFVSALAKDGVVTCSWGGVLFYEKMQPLFRAFFKEHTELDVAFDKHKGRLKQLEQELRNVFPVVEKHNYVITLKFADAEEFMEYIQQVCRPVRELLESRRDEFLGFLKGVKTLRTKQGTFEFQRDTCLYTCRKEE